jgi:cell division protein FtsB
MKKELLRNIILISISLILAFFLFFNEYGLLKYFKLKKELSDLSSQINDIESDLQNLRSEIDSLNNSNFKIEKVAREQFRMIKTNEKVIQFKSE